MEIGFESVISNVVPALKVVSVEADVENSETSDELWALIERAVSDMGEIAEMADINKRPGIRATREAYKALGKEQNRYRP